MSFPCPGCDAETTEVTNTRRSWKIDYKDSEPFTRRHRKCHSCKRIFKTSEIREDRLRELRSAEQNLLSILIRPITPEEAEVLADYNIHNGG